MRFFLLILLILLIFIPLFWLRFQSQPKFSPGDRVRITARLSQEPLINRSKQLFNISGIRVFAPRFPEFHYGDTVVVTGVVQRGKYKLYLADPQIKIIKEKGLLPSLRTRLIEVFKKTLPEPESTLLSGIILGAKETLQESFLSSLRVSGMLHVVVASGMNVTLVARFLIVGLVLFFARRVALIAALFGIWTYVFLIGLDPPIVRAALMGSLAFIAQETGRINFAWWSLFLAVIVMLLFWPAWISDIGFLLSFAATASILAFELPIKGKIEEKLAILPQFLKQDFAISLAAQIGVAPILLFSFGQFTPWSPIVNAILLWTVAPIMILGFLGGLIGLFLEPIGQILLLLTYPLTFIFVRIVEIF